MNQDTEGSFQDPPSETRSESTADEHPSQPSQPSSTTVQSEKTRWQSVYTSFGFVKGYNLPLFIIFGGAMLAFSLARLQYLDLSGHFAAGSSPGEWYWYRAGHYRVGIAMHLGCIIPAGLLMVWQFIPIIRQKALLFHRINGYTVLVLVLVSHVGALMIVRRSFGGLLSTQAATGWLIIATTIAISMAMYNIKVLQIDQHRAWMLRAMIWMGSIITLRLIMVTAALITASIGSYYLPVTCDEILFVNSGDAEEVVGRYPACAEDPLRLSPLPNSTSIPVVVQANFNSDYPEEIAVGLKSVFGTAFWLAITLHIVGTEIYLSLTPAESNRLRRVSYQKQLEAGYARPGIAGLTVERFGDADEWQPNLRK